MPPCVARDVRRLQAVSALLVGLPQTPQIAFARQQVDELILDLSGECVNVATMAMCYVNMSEVLVSLSQFAPGNEAASSIIRREFFRQQEVRH
ncbi:hypothetical protein A3A71_02775 [Candidatus Berkelbacteria bacterium RIFCSPLOWO2_01_FULL_50_28]|uniref:Uncharacterized protein n=1 Tax=Candidatus Berkelbacteria bacterium RIFCSPLOWO2_01_FULL_50_28 TaxID=1797471 RepID=A0A1F5ECF0_9BACT|nr:MAG: hypothetical protein A2807_02310 [Candidatus Berkelbacteria bacterium RIFCSPHIGHO2_01_FULL_50_36]OGD64946.1 MAG: hypothetical protein A3A71_02775 [Candidatus Berkelbacteria bacterium RIFCSPLOWO2_01_FULL_50_28]